MATFRFGIKPGYELALATTVVARFDRTSVVVGTGRVGPRYTFTTSIRARRIIAELSGAENKRRRLVVTAFCLSH